MAKLEAKWVFLDDNTMEASGTDIAVKLDSSGNLSATTSGIKIDVQNPFDMNSNRIINLADGVNDKDAVNLSQLQAVAAQGKIWKEVLIAAGQLVNGVVGGSPDSGGIKATQILQFDSNLGSGDTIVLEDGNSTQETWVAGTDFSIGASINDTIDNIAAAITGSPGSSLVGALVHDSLAGLDPTNNVLCLPEMVIGSGMKIWMSQGNTKVNILDSTMDNPYESLEEDLVQMPSSDPGSPNNYGWYRIEDDLVPNETHLTRREDATYTWDSDEKVWNLTGSTSIPDATKSSKGKVQISDGIAVSSGIISLDLLSNEGLLLNGGNASPNKKLGVDYDDSTIGIVGNKLAVKTSGITNNELLNSAINLSAETGSGTVSLGGTLTITGGTGIDTSISSSTYTITANLATDSIQGVASFNSADFVVGAGDVTLVDTVVKSVATDSGTVTPSSHAVSINGDGDTVSTSGSGDTVTITVQDASTAQKGVAQFDSDDFSVSSGVVSLDGDVPQQFDADSGSATPSSGVLNIIGDGTVLSTSGASNTVTVSAADATTTTKGIASFDASDFDVSSGAVTLEDSVLKQLNGDSGNAQGAGHAISVLGDSAQGVSTSGSGSTLTVTVADATTSSKGVAEFTGADFSVAAGTVSLAGTVVQSVGSDSGSATPAANAVNIMGGEGIDTSATGDTVTISAEDAEVGSSGVANKGIASFEAADFDVTSGHISLDGTVPQSFSTDGSAATPALGVLAIEGGEGIDTDGSGATVTITGEVATTSNKGIASFDADHFTVTTGNVAIAADAIDDTLIDWGSGANQVDASDLPIDSGGTYGSVIVTLTATNVQDALEELEGEIDGIDERQVETFTLDGTDISNGYVTLAASPVVAADTVLHVKGAGGQFYGDDFTVATNQVTFAGNLASTLASGDKLTIIYAT